MIGQFLGKSQDENTGIAGGIWGSILAPGWEKVEAQPIQQPQKDNTTLVLLVYSSIALAILVYFFAIKK